MLRTVPKIFFFPELLDSRGNEYIERGCSANTGAELRRKGLVNKDWCMNQKNGNGMTEKKCFCFLNKCNGTL